jgi:hypothetical protein
MSPSRYILPFTLVILSGLMFVLYVYPTYQDIAVIQTNKEDYQSAIDSAGEIRDLQGKLLAQVESISERDRARLEKLLPTAVDQTLLLFQINSFAQRHGLILHSPSVTMPSVDAQKSSSSQKNTSVLAQFDVTAPYPVFKTFMRDLEQELTLQDVRAMTITGGVVAGVLTPESSVLAYHVEIELPVASEYEKPKTRVPRVPQPNAMNE